MEDQRVIEILLRLEENQKKFFSEALSLLRNQQVKTTDEDIDYEVGGSLRRSETSQKKPPDSVPHS